MELIAIVAVVGMYFYFSHRIKTLEKLIQSQHPSSKVTHTPTPATEPQPAQTHAPLSSTPTPHPASVPQAYTPTPNPFIEWLKEDLFVKLGALLLLIAFGWFVSYAFANNWIGPMGRITLGLLLGASIMCMGVWRIKTHAHQGAIFTVLGSTTVLLTVFAAREIYEFFTPVTALGMMFLSVVFVAFVAVRYQRQLLALAGLVLGAVAPLLTNTAPDTVGIFSYLIVLVLGSLWVMQRIGVVILPPAAFVVVALYSAPYLIGFASEAEQSIALLFGFAFTFIFFASNLLSILKRHDEVARQVHILVALGTGLYLGGWIWAAVDPVWQSLSFVVWAVVFAMGAFLVYVRTAERIPFYMYGAVSIGLLAAATASELTGPALTIAYSIEVTALMAVAALGIKSNDITLKLSFLLMGPVVMSLEHVVADSWSYGFLHSDFAALAVLMLCGWMCSFLVTRHVAENETIAQDTATMFFVAGSLYAGILVWLSTHAVLASDAATAVSLFVYTIVGIALYLFGHANENDALRIFGGVIVGLVVGRLLLVEVWMMELTGRIITFGVIGVLLLSTAFLRKTKEE